ncbi:MAG: hypothetical protein KAT79_02000 [candidate division Zixibacteria bacterium]|nr:hypothetical protein [candidate division Zixibacteria bacterium]
MNRSFTCCVTVLLVVALSGCGTSYRRTPAGEKPDKRAQTKIPVEAYLFDARVHRDGKPTSFRLEIFQDRSDRSRLALGGRGYLGKGALKGWMRSDSLKIFFPSTREYVYEAVTDIFGSFNCVALNLDHGLERYFTEPPEVGGESGLTVELLQEKKKFREYVIHQPGCAWQLTLRYDLQKNGWRVKRFEFDDGDKFRLTGKRREYKARAMVWPSKFIVPIPAGAVRIIL